MEILTHPFRVIWRNIKLVISTLSELNAEYGPLLQRLKQAPGLPPTNPTNSYWLQDPPFPDLVNIQSEKFPTEADIVVVGSGITGASIAWAVLEEALTHGRSLSVVVLEAREICSGATGRNGGHIKPASYQLFHILSQRLNVDDAAQVVRFQRMHIDCLVDLCKEEKFDAAECRKVETCDLFLDEGEFVNAKNMARVLHKEMPDIPASILNAEEARAKFDTNEKICGAIFYDAGALWPYRFVTSVWSKLLSKYSKHLHIETSTPVESVTVGDSRDHPFRVKTPRGTISATHVVHATNAFASQLLPKLRSKMSGVRAHMSAHSSGSAFPGSQGGLSWSFVYPKGYDYLTQRPGEHGDLLLGGGFSIGATGGLDNVANWDDSTIDAQTEAYLRGILPSIFQKADDNPLETAVCRQVWSGTVCVTGDFLPFVGRIDPKISGRKSPQQADQVKGGARPSEWIAAGYIGDGMAYAWLSGVAVALQILGCESEDRPPRPGVPGERLDSWFPAALRITPKRIAKLDVKDIADML